MHIMFSILALLVLIVCLKTYFNPVLFSISNETLQAIAGVALLLFSALLLLRAGAAVGVPFALAGAGLLGLRREDDGTWRFARGFDSGAHKAGDEQTGPIKPHIKTDFLHVILSTRRAELHVYLTSDDGKQVNLAELSDEELRNLWDALKRSAASQSLLYSYVAIDRSDELFDQFDGLAKELFVGAMKLTVPKALGVLGLRPTPSKEEIVRAHRRLIKLYHPDLCKTPFLASQINAAKDFLI